MYMTMAPYHQFMLAKQDDFSPPSLLGDTNSFPASRGRGANKRARESNSRPLDHPGSSRARNRGREPRSVGTGSEYVTPVFFSCIALAAVLAPASDDVTPPVQDASKPSAQDRPSPAMAPPPTGPPPSASVHAPSLSQTIREAIQSTLFSSQNLSQNLYQVMFKIP